MKISKSNFQLQMRQISYKSIRTWYAGLVKPKKQEPPYKHIIQVGDPILRTKSDPVPTSVIQSPEIKFLLKYMKVVFKSFNCVGLSATQIGIPVRIFMIEFNKEHAKCFDPQEFKNREMELLPQTIVLNPEMKIIDYTKIVYPEACESVKGFCADVPRYRSVQVKGFDEHGKPLLLKANGWLARIIQHEMDHLNGAVYTDIMLRKSLTCVCWEVINQHGGKVELPYGTK